MSDNIKVAVRVRPLIPREIKKSEKVRWLPENNTVYYIDDEGQKTSECYSFDHIFDGNTRNDYIYQTIGKPLVETAVKGINATIFAYGQTSSGKTHTMMGDKTEMGFIALAVKDMFYIIGQTSSRKFLIRTSFLEIYNEKINDLLDKEAKDIKLREDTNGNVFVKVTEKITTTKDEVLGIMAKGEKNRQIGETNMNERSSRSHTIFRIIIESSEITDTENVPVQVSQLNFVDLAGSERVSQTKASGVRLKEGSHINKSLTVLGIVIRQLSEGADYVNFRDSKLTRMLQQSLGGNAKTVIVAAITPVSVENGQSTLAFAQRAKTIKNKPEVNEILTDSALMKRYEIKMNNLKKELNEQYSVNKNLETDQVKKDRLITELTERIHILQKNFVVAKKLPIKSNRRHTIAQPTGFHLNSVTEGLQILENDLQFISRTPLDQFELDLIEEEKERASVSIGFKIPQEPGPSENANRKCFSTSIPKKSLSRLKIAQQKEQKTVQVDSIPAINEPEMQESLENVTFPRSPGTPKSILRSRVHHLQKELEELQQFTNLELEVKNEETVEGLRGTLRDYTFKFADLQLKFNEAEAGNKEKDDSIRSLEEKNLGKDDTIKSLEEKIKEQDENLLKLAQEHKEELNMVNLKLVEQQKLQEESEKKLKKQCQEAERNLVEKEFIFGQLERKYKQRIDELLLSIDDLEKKETPKKSNKAEESIVIAPAINNVYLEENLNRISSLEEQVKALLEKESKYLEEISLLKQNLQEEKCFENEDVEYFQQGLQMLQTLLQNDTRRKSIFSDSSDSKENVSTQLEDLIRIPYKRIQHLEKHKMSYEQTINNLNTSLLDKTQYIKELEEKCNLTEDQTDLSEYKKQNEVLKEEISNLSKQIEGLEIELSKSNEKLLELEFTLDNKNAQINSLGAQLDSLESEMVNSKDSLENVKGIQEKETEINNLKQNLKCLEDNMLELTKLNEEINLLKIEKTQLANEIKELLCENDIFKNDNEALNQEVNNAELKIKQQTAIIDDLKDLVNVKTEELKKLQETLLEKETSCKSFQKDNQELKKSFDNIKNELETNKINSNSLELVNNQLESLNENYKLLQDEKIYLETQLKDSNLLIETLSNNGALSSVQQELVIKNRLVNTLSITLSGLGQELEEANEQLASKETNINQLKFELESETEFCEKFHKNNEDLIRKLKLDLKKEAKVKEEYEKTIKNNQELIKKLQEDIEKSNNDIRNYETTIKTNNTLISKLENENINVNSINEEYESTIKINKEDIEKLNNDIKNYENTVETNKTLISKLENDIVTVNSIKEEYEATIKCNKDEINRLISELEANKENMTKTLQEKENVLLELKNTLQESILSSSDKETTLSSFKKQLDAKEKEIKVLQENIHKFEQQLITKNCEIKNFVKQLINKNHEMDKLQQQLLNKNSEVDKFNEIVNSKDDFIKKLQLDIHTKEIKFKKQYENIISNNEIAINELRNHFNQEKQEYEDTIINDEELISKLQSDIEKQDIVKNEYEATIKNNKDEMNNLISEVQLLKSGISEKDNVVLELKKTLQEKCLSLSEKEMQLSSLKKQIDNKEMDIKELRNQIKQLEQQTNDKNSEELIKKLLTEIDDLKTSESKLKMEYESITVRNKTEIDKLLNEMKNTKNCLVEKESIILTLKKSLEENRSNLNEKEENIVCLNKEMSIKQLEIKELNNKMKQLEINFENRQKDVENLQKQVSNLENDKTQSCNRIKQLQDKIGQLENQIENEKKNSKEFGQLKDKNNIISSNDFHNTENNENSNTFKKQLDEKNTQLSKNKEEISKLKTEVQSLKDTVNKQNLKSKERSNQISNELIENQTKLKAISNCCLIEYATNTILCQKCNITSNIIPKEYVKSNNKCIVSLFNDGIKLYNELVEANKKDKGVTPLNFWQTKYKTLEKNLDLEITGLKDFLKDKVKSVQDEEDTLTSLWDQPKNSVIDKLQSQLNHMKQYITDYDQKMDILAKKCNSIDEFEQYLGKMKLSNANQKDQIENLTSNLNSEKLQVVNLCGKLNVKQGEIEKLNKQLLQNKKLLDENTQFKSQFLSLKGELLTLRNKACIKCGNVPFALGQDENVNVSNILGGNSDQTRKIYQENKELKEKIRDMEREWKGSMPLDKIRRERRQSIQNANRSLIESCADCEVLKTENAKYLQEIQEVKAKIKTEYSSRAPETVDYYKDKIKVLEKKLSEQRRHSRSCEKCLKKKLVQDQEVQVTPLQLDSMHIAQNKEFMNYKMKYDKAKEVARLRSKKIDELELKLQKCNCK